MEKLLTYLLVFAFGAPLLVSLWCLGLMALREGLHVWDELVARWRDE